MLEGNKVLWGVSLDIDYRVGVVVGGLVGLGG